MAKTIPMIITNSSILVKDKDSDEFKQFNMPSLNPVANIPFYHEFAERIAECQHFFKEFLKGIYGKKLSKFILAIIVPDDTTKLESIFINEFFVNSGACKAVAQMPMCLALQKDEDMYISISKSQRNVIMTYVRNHEIIVKKHYDLNEYDPAQIKHDAEKIHIDTEYNSIPIYVNNFNQNMDNLLNAGAVVTPKDFMKKIAAVDVEKI